MKRNIFFGAFFSALALLFVFGFSGCNNEDNNQNPSKDDYVVDGNFSQIVGNTSPITVTPKAEEGKAVSPGKVTVYYEGISGTTFARNAALPEASGVFTVTFDVDAAKGWNGRRKMPAGVLTINTEFVPDLFEIEISRVITLFSGVIAQRSDVSALLTSQGITTTEAKIATISAMLWSGAGSAYGFPKIVSFNSITNLYGSQSGKPNYSYEDLAYDADLRFFHDKEGKNEFKGTDPIDPTTKFYSTIDWALIEKTVTGGKRYTFTISELVTAAGKDQSIITGSMTLNDLLNAIKTGLTYQELNEKSISFNINGTASITSSTQITSNWPVEDVASMCK